MIDTAIAWVAWLYIVTNSLRVFFYAPQILAVWKDDDGARVISITTWGFWTVANLTAALYGGFVLRDGAFSAIFIGNVACTGAVTLIAIRKRLRWRASRAGVPAAGGLPT